MFSNKHYNDGHIAVVVPAPQGIRAMLIEGSPERFCGPPYVGGADWAGIAHSTSFRLGVLSRYEH